MIKLKDLIGELFYEVNLGTIDVVAFYQRATDEQRIKLERLMTAKKWAAARKFVQQVSKTKLHSHPQLMPDPSPSVGAFGWSQPTQGGGGI